MMLLEILRMLGVFIAAIFLFGLTIFVHELGHFLLARWRGLVVERFAIGFGPRIWGKKIDGVDWCLCAIPFGGFVQLPQLASMETVEGKNDKPQTEYPVAHPFDKMLAAFGGPLFSGMFGLFLAVLVWWAGKPVSAEDLTTTIGYVQKDAPAANAPLPLQPGDVIKAIDNKPVRAWSPSQRSSVIEGIIFSTGEKIQFDVDRPSPDGGPSTLITSLIKPRKDQTLDIRQVGIQPSAPVVIKRVVEGRPAMLAGLKKGDEILELDGQKMFSFAQFSAGITNAGTRVVDLKYKRGDEIASVKVEPVILDGFKHAIVGVEYDVTEKIIHIPPLTLVKDSVLQIKRTVTALTDSKSDIKAKHMSGPIGIMENFIRLLNVDIRLVLWFSVVLNVNLALLNLLPIPVVDGGHIVFCAIEWITRRPLPPRIINGLQTACALLLLSSMVYVTFYDTKRAARRFIDEREMEEKSKTHREIFEFAPAKKPATP